MSRRHPGIQCRAGHPGAYIHGIDVDERFATDLQRQRKGMNLYSLRGAGNAGIDNAHFAFELARAKAVATARKMPVTSKPATFANLPWSPDLTYRYARYSRRTGTPCSQASTVATAPGCRAK